MSTDETPLYGYKFAKELYLDRSDLDMPGFVDLYNLVRNCLDAVEDPEHPLRGYEGPEVKDLLAKADISVRSLVGRLKKSKGGSASEQTVYRWISPEGYGSMPSVAFQDLCLAFCDLSKTPQTAWYSIACLCWARFEEGEKLEESRAASKRQAICNAARTLYGSALDSLYVTAMAYKQAFKEYGSFDKDVWSKNDAHKAAMRIDFEREHRAPIWTKDSNVDQKK